ncbi:hormone-sensitive lipase isoform X2 [Sitophilus oryzae]|uniref:Hormone-sensitive lipase isoform X2 n=1 Tax=Sitophilus oryzae TaxID=7048 RepID=A0A6J2X8B7_SITOR|nr:hormone-sensitive lipase isoform X2 [Sitophilus oryzae]
MTEAEKLNNAQQTSEKPENISILINLCSANADFFAKDSSENGQRLYISFLAIIDALNLLYPRVLDIEHRVSEFDLDENTPGNGYRSFLNVYKISIGYTIDLCQRIIWRKNSILFRKTVLTKELESCAQLMSSLCTCFKHLETMMSWSEDGNIFSENRSMEDMISVCQNVNQYCFYGRLLGFQFCDSLKNVLQFIALSMAIFSEAYYSEGSLISKATNSFMTTTKYITDPEQRAKRIVNISKNANVDFCKAFWFLSESELMNQLPSVVSPNVAVCKVISIAPEPMSLNINGKEIDIPVPNSYLGPRPIQVRLISYEQRQGMLGSKNKTNLPPPSKALLVHCHGGGFVAQSSKSHEGYLRDWAKNLNIPIMSIDYSLAPEAPFPRAHEEVFYAYCWALKNHQFLGSSGEKIITAGDSAGANLLLSLILKCIHTGVPTPHGMFAAYVPTLVKFVPSPARLLCMMDPLLPFGFLMRCLKAYACPQDAKQIPNGTTSPSGNNFHSDDSESFEEVSESDLAELQAHKSPVSEASDTLTYGSLNSANLDDLDNKVDLTSVEIEKSQKLMADIVHKYVLESDTETDGTKTSLVDMESTSSSTPDTSFQNRLYGFVSGIKGHFSKMLGERGLSGAEKLLETDRPNAVWEDLCFPVPNNPYLSPYCASDEDLKKFPPTKILTVQLDPCLDDCVMFAKKLRRLGNDVHLDILEGLPHGFLNFSLISKDAHEGSKLCVQRMKELLDLGPVLK